MSKTWRSRLAALVVLAVFAPFTSDAQSPKRATQEATSTTHGAVARSTDALTASDDILKQVSALRGLAILQPVPSGFKSRDEIHAIVLKDLDESSKPEEFETNTALLRFLGLVGADFELKRATTSLLTEQIAGFYEPKTHFFYLADWIPLEEQRTVIAHELTHALADQHFDLRRFEKWPAGDGDAKLAAHALVEGEATALMVEYSLRERGLPADLGAIPISLTDVLKAGVSEPDPLHPVFSNAPDVLKQSLQFPYVYGAGFVQALIRKGSWRSVDECYRALPASTEQIMHPDKYVRNETPVRVSLHDVGPLLGHGWRLVEQDVSGEFGYFVTLKAMVPEKSAAVAAAGWAGDRYFFYLDSTKAKATYVHKSVWDTPNDAAEFFDAYAARISKRFSVAPKTRSANRIDWSTREGLVRLERRGTTILAVEGFRGVDMTPVADALWKEAKRPNT
jgi:hypothetical protein